MPRPATNRPAYLLHKASGQARVRIAGRDIYLGKHDSPESWEKYYRLLAELHSSMPSGPPPAERPAQLSIAELAARYVEFAEGYYRGNPDEKHRIKAAITPLIELYASLPVTDFGPLKLQQVRQHLIDRRNLRNGRPLSRKYVNQLVGVMKQVFKWGVSTELVPATVYHALTCVGSLRKGRTIGVAESHPIRLPMSAIPANQAVRAGLAEIAYTCILFTRTFHKGANAMEDREEPELDDESEHVDDAQQAQYHQAFVEQIKRLQCSGCGDESIY